MKTTKLFWPARSKPSFADWITQHLGTSRWHVGETALGSTAISPESATALQAQYDTLYGKDGDGARTPTGFSEIATPIANLPAWLRWLDENPWARSSDYIDAAVANIKRAGMHDPILGYARPSEIAIDKTNLRESLVFRGLNSRLRAVLQLVVDLPQESRVYAPESVTALAGVLRDRFPNFVGSEYLPTEAERTKFPDTRHEDVQNLSFRDGELDCYVSCEVMEHIPAPAHAIGEAARVLRRGGQFIATFPFAHVAQESIIKAVVEHGTIRHLMTPEYHGNPVDQHGSLVFTIPGWDIVNNARAAGFATVNMVAMSSRKFGIIADIPILVMRAVR